MRRGFQVLLEADVTAAVGAQLYQRCPVERGSHRNDYCKRGLTTQVGGLHLQIHKELIADSKSVPVSLAGAVSMD